MTRACAESRRKQARSVRWWRSSASSARRRQRLRQLRPLDELRTATLSVKSGSVEYRRDDDAPLSSDLHFGRKEEVQSGGVSKSLVRRIVRTAGKMARRRSLVTETQSNNNQPCVLPQNELYSVCCLQRPNFLNDKTQTSAAASTCVICRVI